jgi:hypothetical protein
VYASLPLAADPTAVQTVADVHDTALSEGYFSFAGLGSDWEVQVVPSQTSASWPPAPPGRLELPTAAQSLADVHDTPLRDASPAGLGTLWTVQLVPSQASASVAVVLMVYAYPTAVQAVADGHDTPFS